MSSNYVSAELICESSHKPNQETKETVKTKGYYTDPTCISKRGEIDRPVSPIFSVKKKGTYQARPVEQTPDITDLMYNSVDQWLSSKNIETGEVIESLDNYFKKQKEAISKAHCGAFSNLSKTGLSISSKSSLFQRRNRLKETKMLDSDVKTQDTGNDEIALSHENGKKPIRF